MNNGSKIVFSSSIGNVNPDLIMRREGNDPLTLLLSACGSRVPSARKHDPLSGPTDSVECTGIPVDSVVTRYNCKRPTELSITHIFSVAPWRVRLAEEADGKSIMI